MTFTHKFKRTICWKKVYAMVRYVNKTLWVTTTVCSIIGLIVVLSPPRDNHNIYTANIQRSVNTQISPIKPDLTINYDTLRKINAKNVNDYPTQPPETFGYSSKTCSPISKIVFLKVHKTGSSTVANIFQRFGVTHELNFAVPNKKPHEYGYNYIGKPGGTIQKNFLLPIPEGETYDILWNHVVYNRTAFRAVMPPETIYVSIIREPFEQFVSAFEYYKMYNIKYIKQLMTTNVSNPISVYLKNFSKSEPPSRHLSHIRNKMVADFGMTLQQLHDSSKRRKFLKDLDTDFELIMIMEYFDESLILLRRTLCWSHKDILYFSQNRNPFRPRRQYDTEDRKRHKELSKADYELYEYFYGEFVMKMSEHGKEFFEEVRHFRHILKNVWDHCTLRKTLKIQASKWSEAFELTARDCKMMRTSELTFLDKIISDTSNRYNRHVFNMNRLSE